MISGLTVKIAAKPFEELHEAEKFWLVAEFDGNTPLTPEFNNAHYEEDLNAIRRVERKLHSWTWKYWDFVGEEMGWFDDRIDPTIYFLADESKLFNALARTIHAMHQEPK